MSDKVQSPIFESKVKPNSARFERNVHTMAELVTRVRNEEEVIHQGGGDKAIESQHKKGRLTARERIALLIDEGTEFFEAGDRKAELELEPVGAGASGSDPAP